VTLYDNNEYITMESGSVDVTTLPAGDNSAFSVSLLGTEEENVDHYVIFPAGTPSS
jgi:hypothetical protein